ncbi:nitrate- and nitrite sensing domain-containing protein [Streptomyces durbertensis]|uniref:histidine kinase n=1 Tax=Streptomyces durbertensis TaxID=2448886 RepID=A0ABR6EF85_9ACTN|nr:nitrate- and nitrite sensing domain-containing protein [Streptomyces durbertensis]MBB1244008.1 nitrate- and nitrite sensing domain-containing protein [Streptomyces durbertensis]
MQGRFKRDGKAAADPELRGSADRGSAAKRAQEGGTSPVVRDSDEPTEGVKQDASAAGGKAGPKEPSSTGSRLALRNWRISTRLVSLLALPVVAATTLGAFRIADAISESEQLENMQLLTEMTQQATELAAALQEERDRSAGPLTAHGNAKDDTVVGPRERTDQAKDSFNDNTRKLSDQDDKHLAGVRATVIDIGRQLNRIKDIRERAYENSDAVAETVSDYNRIIESLLALSQDMAQATSNPEMIESTRALAAFSTAKEYASIQRAVISAGLAAPDGPELSENDRRFGSTAYDNERAAMSRFSVIYGDDSAELTKSLDGGIVNITSATEYATRVFKSADGIKAESRSYMDWYDQHRTKIDEMGKIEKTLLTQMDQQARELRNEARRDVILNGAMILLVLGISFVGAFVVARSMVRSLRRLQDTAQEVSRKRLPELVKQLSESDPQDVDTTVESVGVHSRDEIGKVAAAFDDVHREAVRLAGEQALLRGNVNAMFTNLSRRSQGLIQRQLSLISELESREADPDQLASLFKLDHLATRMRRNGENLLVLAGEEPGRRWTRPVPLVDVLRAAASEVEQYERIELSGVPTAEVAGRVVNDLVHLLAELLENATSFSSPQTKVRVTGHALPDGRVLVEIHDTGIGLSPEDLAAINDRLASPPTVDVSVSRRMGLFVVGRLSLRHGIRIQLRPSDSGGTTALVMLPVDVTQSGAAKGGPAQRPQGQGQPPAAGGSRLGQMSTRAQMGGGQRPALPAGGSRPGSPGQPGQHGQPGGQGPFGGPGPNGGPNGGQQPNAGPGAGRPAPALGRPAGAAQDGPPRRPAERRPAQDVPAPKPPTQPAPQQAPRPQAQPPADRAGNVPGEQRQLPGRGPIGELPAAPEPRRPESQRPEPQRPEPQRPEAPTGERRPGWADSRTGAQPEAPRSRTADETPRGHEDSESTGEYARPGFAGSTGGRDGRGEPTGHGPSVDLRDDTTELDIPIPATATANTRTPIFEEMESSWFAARSGAREQQPSPDATRTQPMPQVRQQPASRPAEGQPASRPGGAPAPRDGGNWQASPNDDRWRRAERLRQPAAGGVTTSGLPRRVPKANLVEGTAQTQSAQPAGPQVSRAPDAVRGRLTNLRRGIQQGRQAGGTDSNDRGLGPTHQQER